MPAVSPGDAFIDALRNNPEDRKIPTKKVADYCGVSSTRTIALYLKSVGAAGRRKLTAHDAFFFVARSRWKTVCKESGERYEPAPGYAEMRRVLKIWVERGCHTAIIPGINNLEAGLDVDGDELPKKVTEMAGRAISERSLYRICRENPNLPLYRKRNQYPIAQVEAIAETWRAYRGC